MNDHEVIVNFEDMGYVAIDGDMRIRSIVSELKVINFHRYANPLLYQEFYETDDLSIREEVKDRTPQLTREDYVSVSMLLFSEEIKEAGWYVKMAGPRICFYEPVGEAYFVLSNTQLQFYLVVAAKKLGAPDRFIILPSFAKNLMQQLKHIVALDEMDMMDD